jgi:enoyl-CoA hydratase
MPQAAGQIRTRIEERGPDASIAYVTIDNARKLNTFNSPLMRELVASMRALEAEPGLRAVVIEGAGSRAFIGGANLDELLDMTPASARAYIQLCSDCNESIRAFPTPVIARIDGYAIGAGMEVAICCDLRAASKSSVFAMPEVKLGVPSVVEAALLPFLVGRGRAREILLLGETFTAEEAGEWGLVERVVESSELDETIERWIKSLILAEPRAVRMQKRLMRAWEDLPLRGAVKTGVDCFAEAWETDEPRQAVQKFVAAEKQRKSAKTNGQN